MIKFNLKEISPKLFVGSVIPPAIVALFACAAFSLVNTSIVKKNVTAATNAGMYKLKSEIQGVLQPNMDKMSNWQAIVQEIHEEKALSRVLTIIGSLQAVTGSSLQSKTAVFSPLLSRTLTNERGKPAQLFHRRSKTRTEPCSE